MRSDNLERHTKIHDAILDMSDDEAREELKARHAANMERKVGSAALFGGYGSWPSYARVPEAHSD